MTNQDVLRVERDGVEYFTIVATGESGMSQSGLARACGVKQPSLSELVAKLNPIGKTSSKTPKALTSKGFNPIGKAPSKWLEPFVGKDLNLTTNAIKNGGSAVVYTSDFCAAAIKHYAYKGSEAAQDFDYQLGRIGLASYIQSVTGWLPEEFKAAPEAHKKLDEFLGLAMEWDRGVMLRVDEDGIEVDMSDSWTFFDEVVFAGFTVDDFIQFEKENRELGLGDYQRSEQVKLFFERNPETAERLQPYIDRVQRMLGETRKPQVFLTAFVEAFGGDPESLYWETRQKAIDVRIARLLKQRDNLATSCPL